MFACSDHCAVSFRCWVHGNKVSKTRFYLLQFFGGGSSVIRRPNLQSCIQSVCLTYQTDSNWHDSLYWAYIRWLKSSLAFYTSLVGRTYSRAWNFHWSAGRWSVKCPTDQWKSPSTGLLDQQFLQASIVFLLKCSTSQFCLAGLWLDVNKSKTMCSKTVAWGRAISLLEKNQKNKGKYTRKNHKSACFNNHGRPHMSAWCMTARTTWCCAGGVVSALLVLPRTWLLWSFLVTSSITLCLLMRGASLCT